MSRSLARIAWTLRRIRYVGWLVAICCPFATANAQYSFDSWTADKGLPQNSISAILQTRDGYLWLTTSDGLVRFDGVHFTTFDRNNSPGFSGNYLTSLYEDRDGALWIGADNNHLIRYRHHSFVSFTMENTPAGEWVHTISGNDSGSLWVSLNDRVMHWADGRFSPAPAAGLLDDARPHARIVERTNRGGLWAATPAGLAVFAEGRSTAWTRRDGIPGGAIQAVGKDERGALWVASDGGLAKIHDGKLTPIGRPPQCLTRSDLNFVSGPILSLVCVTSEKELSLISLSSWKALSIGPLPSDFPRNLKGSVFYGDREGNLWVGTASQGLYRARKQPVTVYSQSQGLRDRNVYTVLQDHTGAIWLGSWPSTLSRFQNGTITNYTKKDGLTGLEITSLYEDHVGRLWVGAYGDDNGMRIFERGRFLKPMGLKNLGVVKAILQDGDDAFWFGAENKLVRYFNGVPTTYTNKDGLASSDANALITDSAGGIWIGGYGGLTRFRDGKFTAYTEREGLPGSNVRALYQDADGVLWIGTYDGGLGRFKDGRFTRYTVRDGLFNNGVFEILEDARGNLWMSSNHGIYRARKSELNEFAAGRRTWITSVSYGKEDGMRTVECNGGHWPPGAKSRDGSLWFPTQDGVAVIYPATVSTNLIPPPIAIESFLIDRAAVATDADVRIRPGQDDVEIRYTALSLINSDRIKFRYMLDGLDSTWVEAGGRRTAYYSHIPPGHYSFKVIAANSDGVWNSVGRTFAFAVVAPFYRTVWFAALVLSSIAAMTVFVWQYRVAEWKRAHATQLTFSRQLILSQESERKRIAAELHDSLGQSLAIIKTRALLTLREPENQEQALEQLDEIAQGASHSIDELKEIAYNLRPYHLERLGLQKSLQAMLNQIETAEGLRIRAEFDPLDALSPETQINIYRIVQESVSNIVKHAAATEARVTIKRKSRGVDIVIEDNGKGFGQEDRGIRNMTNSGFGLISIAERARVLGGDLAIESTPAKGTTLRIRVTLDQSPVC